MLSSPPGHHLNVLAEEINTVFVKKMKIKATAQMLETTDHLGSAEVQSEVTGKCDVCFRIQPL